MGRTQYPSGPMLVIRDCMKAICIDNSAATKLLCALMYWYDHSSTDAINGVFIVKRTQSELVHQDMCDETNVTTLHSVAIPFLQLLGYLDIEGKDGTLHYLIHVDKVHAALVAYSKKSLPDFLRASVVPQLQKFGIELTEKELKEFVINSKILEKELQKIVIANKENCNCKRGRKPRTEEALRAKMQPPRESRELQENKKRESKTIVLQPLLPSSPPSQNGHKPPSQSKPEGTKQPTQLRPKTDEIVLTEDEQRIFDLYCQAQSLKVPPKLTVERKQHCALLAPYVDNCEEMVSLVEFAKKWLKKRNIHVKVVELGNMVKSDVLNNWEKPTVNQPELVPDTDETTIVAWSKDPASLPKKQKDVLDNFDKYRAMTKAEARKYGWDESVALTPNLQNDVLSRLELWLVDGVPLEELKPQISQIA